MGTPIENSLLAGRDSAFFAIDRVSTSAYTIPTDLPEADGTFEWNKTTIVVAEATARGVTGLGYTYADVSTAKLIDTLLRPIVEGRDAMDVPGSWIAMVRAIRNLGRPGIASMAISAVDIALWDLKARLLNLPLLKLLGVVREVIPIYGSGGFTSYSIAQLQQQLSDWSESGIGMVKMKIGSRPADDLHRVHAAREAIGRDTQLFVDANGAYTRKQASKVAEQVRDHGVTWFEEPVSSDDLEGLRLIRDTAPPGMNIAAGEYGYQASYFRNMLDAGAVDVLQADATRCGGITGFLQVDAMCLARSLPLSAHTAPSVHSHICCVAQQSIHVEYFHDHARIETLLFEGAATPKNGGLSPDCARPGLGLTLRQREAARWLAQRSD